MGLMVCLIEWNLFLFHMSQAAIFIYSVDLFFMCPILSAKKITCKIGLSNTVCAVNILYLRSFHGSFSFSPEIKPKILLEFYSLCLHTHTKSTVKRTFYLKVLWGKYVEKLKVWLRRKLKILRICSNEALKRIKQICFQLL